MTELEKAARMALEALDEIHAGKRHPQLALAVAHNLRKALTQALATTEQTLNDTLRDIDAATCPECGGLGVSDPGEPDSPEGPGRPAVDCKPCKGTGWRNGVHLPTAQPATTERKGEPVWSDLGAWLWAKLADYCRRKGLNPHHENDLFNLAGELRAMLAHRSPQVPEDVIVILDECRTALMECDRDCDYELIDRAYAAIDAERKGE